MIMEETKDQATTSGGRTYTRSVSWSERPPRKSSAKPHWNSKARACLPPLSIIRPTMDEWPKAGSDDLGIWPNPPTPGARTPNSEQPPKEFECQKEKLAFFEKECSRILDHVYLGSDAIAKNREVLRRNGITHVLNCVGFVCPEYFKKELVYRTLWLQDCPSEDITSILYDVFDYFEDVRQQGGRVLVHCCQGVSRSTSLVIAYVMWIKGQSFDDAFQHVKAARGVTNPNVGFACQLLQCQKRVHAQPASPTSVVRMYRMAPHSPYDPLHLVPKMLSEPGAGRLDSRGAFIVHIPSALYIWIGKDCSPMMSDNAMAAASQVVRYERAHIPVITVNEGEEVFQFWNAFSYGKGLDDGCDVTVNPCLEQRKLNEYDSDFELFNKALTGGVVPPLPSSEETGSETCLPAKENSWNKLRKKFANGFVRDFVTSSKSDSSDTQRCNGPQTVDSCKELSRSPSFNFLDSVSSLFVSKPKCDLTALSVSPSTSDYSSSSTISPSSSDWPNSSFISRAAGLCSTSGETFPVLPPLAERRGTSLPILPSINEGCQISDDLARILGDDVVMEVQCTNISTLQDEKKYDTFNLVLYKWPSMHKMDIDYRSVFVVLIPEVSFGMKVADALYVWIGRDVSSKGSHSRLIGHGGKYEDNHGHFETAALSVPLEGGFSTDAQIKMAKEGREHKQIPEPEHPAGSLQKGDLDGSIKRMRKKKKWRIFDGSKEVQIWHPKA